MAQTRFRGSELASNFIDNPVAFFKGEGGFFYKDRDRGSHLYGASMSLLLDCHVNKNTVSMDDFILGFKSFILQLDDSRLELYHFLKNISAFNRCMYNEKVIGVDLFANNMPLCEASKKYLPSIKDDYSQEGFFDEIDKGAEPFYAIEKFYPQSGGYALLKERLVALGLA